MLLVAAVAGLLVVSGCGDDPAEDEDNQDEEPELEASFTYEPEEPLSGQTVTFDASESTVDQGSIVSYDWQFGDGEDGHGQVVQNTYAEGGEYTVVLTVTDDADNTEIQQQTVSVEQDVDIEASFDWEPETPVAGEEVSFDGGDSTSSAGDIVEWHWDFGGDDAASGEIVDEFVFDEGGDYDVELEVVDEEDNSATTSETVTVTGDIEVRIEQQPLVPWVGEQALYDGGDSVSTDGDIVEWNWTFGDDTESGESVEYTFEERGEHDVELEVVDEEDNSNQDTESVRIAEAVEVMSEDGDGTGDQDLLETEDGDLLWTYGDTDNNAYVFRSTDGGESWTQAEHVEISANPVNTTLFENQDGNLYWTFFGEFNDESAYMYRSTDGGENWSEHEVIGPDTEENERGYASQSLLEDSEGNMFWALGPEASLSVEARLYQAKNGDEDWEEIESVELRSSISAVELMEDTDGNLYWAAGSRSDLGDTVLYRSTDGGENWSEESVIDETAVPDPGGMELMEDGDGNLYWTVLAEGGEMYLHRSTDGGEDWDETIEHLAGEGSSVTLFEDSNGNLYWIFGEHAQSFSAVHMHRSTDGGEEWDDYEEFSEGYGLNISLAEDDTGALYMTYSGDLDFAEDEFFGGPLYRSHDGGETWNDVQRISQVTVNLWVVQSGDLFWGAQFWSEDEQTIGLLRAVLSD